jgi:hypothetical protein
MTQPTVFQKRKVPWFFGVQHAISRFVNSWGSGLAKENDRFAKSAWAITPPSFYLWNSPSHKNAGDQRRSPQSAAIKEKAK